MVFGYARVRTNEQNLDLQIDAFLREEIKAKNIYTDKVSSAREDRKSLTKLLKYAREGDTIVVWKLDRLARSLIHFTNFINQLDEKGIKFRSITEPFLNITDKPSHSQFIVSIFAALAQLERDIVIERTKAGMASARARGKVFGAPKGISKKNQQKSIICAQYFKEGRLTVNEICERAGVSRATYYKYLRYQGLDGKLRPYKQE